MPILEILIRETDWGQTSNYFPIGNNVTFPGAFRTQTPPEDEEMSNLLCLLVSQG